MHVGRLIVCFPSHTAKKKKNCEILYHYIKGKQHFILQSLKSCCQIKQIIQTFFNTDLTYELNNGLKKNTDMKKIGQR